ncbi:MAG: nuclear transport factor 2 family protein [Leisingera sp.]
MDMHSFIADWFGRFDRLEPVEAFLADLHPNVDWDMPDADPNLEGHARVRAWYAGVLDTFQRPTEHHVTGITVGGSTVSFYVTFRSRTLRGGTIEAHVREDWRFEPRPNGRPLITHYSARLLEEANS